MAGNDWEDTPPFGAPPRDATDQNLAWLADADRDRREERLQRLEGDRDLAETLRAANFAGRDYDTFANEIAKYGLAVIRGWIYKGMIRAKVQEKWGLLEPEPRPGAMIEDADGLADETVVHALNAFRDTVLIPGKWDPQRGASLRTFFVGQCLLQFSNVYKSWCREQRRNYAQPVDLDLVEDGIMGRQPPEADERAIITDQLRHAFGKIADERSRTVFYLNALGHSHRDIATKLSMTEKAVESVMGRVRRQIRDEGNRA